MAKIVSGVCKRWPSIYLAPNQDTKLMQERHFFNLNTRLDEKSDVMINEQILAEEVFEKFIMIETTRFFTIYFLVAMIIL